MVRHSHDVPSPGPSCITVTIEMTYYFQFFSFCVVLLVLFATTFTNIDHFRVLSTMAPKQDRGYACGRSKSGTPSARMVIGSDDERDLEYVPPGTSTPACAAHTPRATPKKVASGVVTASKSDEECTLTGTPSGSATNEEGASGSLGVSWSEEASDTAAA